MISPPKYTYLTVIKSLFFIFIILLAACSRKTETPQNVLLSFGERSLTHEDVVAMIPTGLLPADSASLYKAIVDSWIKDVVLADFAEERLYDITAIDRRVKDYRNGLIVQEYLSRLRDSKTPKIEEDKVKEYYNLHRRELKLEVPVVKGIFLKINSKASGKDEIKRLLTSGKDNDIDKLEQEWLDRALEYNYFRENWVDWESVAGRIPFRFGNPDNFLQSTDFFETEYDDITYYLQISQFIPSGEIQPYEFARNWITTVLTQADLAEYERVLVNSLLEKAIKDKKLIVSGYDPIRHEF